MKWNKILTGKIKNLMQAIFGIARGITFSHLSSREFGLGAILLLQLASTFKRVFGLAISSRQLSEGYNTLERMVVFLDKNLASNIVFAHSMPHASGQHGSLYPAQVSAVTNIEAYWKANRTEAALTRSAASFLLTPVAADPETSTAPPEPWTDFLQQLIYRYYCKTYQSYLRHNGFSQQPGSDSQVQLRMPATIEELAYSIVTATYGGNRLTDIDGNDYINVSDNFFTISLLQQPNLLDGCSTPKRPTTQPQTARQEQREQLTSLISDITGYRQSELFPSYEAALFSVISSLRKEGKKQLVITFRYPSSTGIFTDVVPNRTQDPCLLVLDFGSPESLHQARERAGELCGIIVAPLQPARPQIRHLEYLRQLREIASSNSALLVFDEALTGFCMVPGGFRHQFNIKADIAIFSNGTVGGADHITSVCNDAAHFALTPQAAQPCYGIPDDGPGTANLSPAADLQPHRVAVVTTALKQIRDLGDRMYADPLTKTARLASQLNEAFENLRLPLYMASYQCCWILQWQPTFRAAAILFVLLREKGLYIRESLPCYITTVHSEADVAAIVRVFIEAVNEMMQAGLFETFSVPPPGNNPYPFLALKNAALGMDAAGNPGWFITGPERPARFYQVVL